MPSRGTGNKDIFVTNVCEINHKELWKLNQMKNENCSGITSLWVQILLKSSIFSAFLCNCINCIHNCEDHSSFKDIFIKYLSIVNIHF